MPLQGNDAAIFDLMHSLLAGEGRDLQFERRNNGRRPFNQTQLIAMCHDAEGQVGADDFEKRDCFDLSVSGVSFFADDRPKHAFITLALGRVPFKFLTAKICHARPSEDGRWLVGCKFEKRIS